MRRLLAFAAALLTAGMALAAPPQKVFRYSFPAAETGFDPARINDIYSRTVTAHIFDGLYQFDPLRRPFLVRPNVADGMPQHSDDYRTWTVRLRPGIYFDDDPAFKGRKRELVAQDIVYSYKRIFDPENKSPVYSGLAEEGMLGLEALREQALKSGRFDYDREVEGLRALDRYTVQFRLAEPRPRFIYTLAAGDLFGAVAREVIEAYPGKSMEHPVGTGPFRLAQWRRSSLIVLERNPNFRELSYDAQPAADDAEGQAVVARFKGRRLPMIDRVEISIIEVQQPRWLAFLNEQFDLLAVPSEFVNLAAPNGKLAPNLAKRGVEAHRVLNPDRTLFYFNMEDPLVGGFAPEKVALRRAISLATQTEREIVTVWRGQAVPAQSVVAPGTWGYDPSYKSENSDYDLPRAKALLDLYGYVDRDGDGWREQPDGAPLLLHYASTPDESSRAFDDLWKRNMDAAGLRLVIDKAQWPEQLKKARAGQLMIWQLGYSAANPDVQDGLGILYGPASGGQNLARFRHARFDEIYRHMNGLPDGPERQALLRECQLILTALMPMKYKVHRIVTDLTQPWVLGYRRPLYGLQFWQYIDIDAARQPRPR
ncbi:MAG TPA: ABC transporter substrate-binding protein [Piscinibacter sp.]|uniref:ABC transporter substrate-binding protein n=1 Tax=Piscinibacter sp. TaxID=1903157 RepID=UPI002CCA4CFB|nr:ABC transporter substrate-binding protein [Piscinibacter sp.]HNK17682.1 ABC transporter substrate-binding protein [Piscinibacter sp.]